MRHASEGWSGQPALAQRLAAAPARWQASHTRGLLRPPSWPSLLWIISANRTEPSIWSLRLSREKRWSAPPVPSTGESGRSRRLRTVSVACVERSALRRSPPSLGNRSARRLFSLQREETGIDPRSLIGGAPARVLQIGWSRRVSATRHSELLDLFKAPAMSLLLYLPLLAGSPSLSRTWRNAGNAGHSGKQMQRIGA